MFSQTLQRILERIMEFPELLLGIYAVVALLIVGCSDPHLAEEIFRPRRRHNSAFELMGPMAREWR